MKRKVLFLCTGNASRSQMAEAIVNHRLPDQWEAASAGTHPVGYVHPLAIRALQEIGIEHHGRSKPAGESKETPFDLVVTVCDSAAEECPVWLGMGKKVHRGFIDPGNVPGGEAEKLAAFRRVRDDMLEAIPELLEESMRKPGNQETRIKVLRKKTIHGGYEKLADTGIAQKLQVKPGRTFLVKNPPQGYDAMIGVLPEGVVLLRECSEPVDILQVFFANHEEMEAQLEGLKSQIKPGGILWVTYHKGTSKVKTDINRDTINAYANRLGMQGVAMISINDDWSALRLKIL